MWGEILNLDHPLIGADNTWMLWAVCVTGAAAAICLEQRYQWAAKVSGAIVALVMAIALSNLGIIPMSAQVWDIVWDYVVPLAIPLLLLQCDMRKAGRESGRLLLLFLISSAGTACGTVTGWLLLHERIPRLNALAGVFTGTYIGGTVNFASLGDAFDVSGEMLSAATVADNLLMAVYFFVLIAIPSIGFFRKHFSHPYIDEAEAAADSGREGETLAARYWGRKEISLRDIAAAAATAFVIVAVSRILADALPAVLPQGGPVLSMVGTLLGNQYLWITTISMVCATAAPGFFGNIRGSQEIGTFLIYIFFFVIGVPASVPMIIQHSPLLLLFAAVVVAVNMVFSLAGGKLLRFNLEEIILCSNANIGGPTTAAAMAVSKGWTRLVGPIILVGIFGYVIGTYGGLLVGSILGA